MTAPSLRRVLALAPLVLLALAACAGPRRHAADELVVMTFNIRYGTAADGEHVWTARVSRVADRIASQAPDVLAIQEGLAFQLDALAEVLVGYRKLGQHREGGDEGEFSGLYVDETRLEVVDWGEFWLSPTPTVVGSRGWDAALPRMAVWADVRLLTGGPVVRVYGTHYDHRGAEARAESSALIEEHAGDLPRVVVTGDFNATDDEPPVRQFLAKRWRSAWLELYPDSTRGTFNGFRDPLGGRRIDHVLYRGLEVREARILGGKVGRLFPSDHDAVVARFRVEPTPSDETPDRSAPR